jgi:hypothetical protein
VFVPHFIHQGSLAAATIAIVLLPPAVLAGAFLIVRRVWKKSFWLGTSAGAATILFPFAVVLAVADMSTALLAVAALASLMLVALATRWAFDGWLRYRPDPGTPLQWPRWSGRGGMPGNNADRPDGE